MPAWKILITDGLDETGLAVLRGSAEVVDRPTITADELLKTAGEHDALIVRGRTKVTAAVFAAAPRLKVVGRAGVGVDNIDLDAARQHGVTVVNAPIATTVSVAELAMGLMLSVMRDLPRADTTTKAGKWLKKEFEGGELYQKTLGVVGYGRIGAAVGKRAAAFGMTVLGYDPLIKPETIKDLGGEPVSLDELYARADVITLHVPLTPETRGSLNAATFARMKRGVRIICAARGGIIDEAALVAALESGQVAGAGLDVFATEPPGATALVTHPRVVVTPHIGAQTVEGQVRAAFDIANEVLAALQGLPLHWKVA
jgi:D-3-phosphoglycerate dehydrogenase / 2-oxoglutarate reductase